MAESSSSSAHPDGTLHVLEEDCPKCGESIIIPFDRFKFPGYVNWIKSTLCNQFMKEGLHDVVERVAKALHEDLKSHINSLQCPHCSSLKAIQTCTNQTCNKLKKTIECYRRYSYMKLENASDRNIKSEELWWDLALLFAPSTSRRQLKNLSDADSSVLLMFMENCLKWIDVIDDQLCIQNARESRNSLMHSGTMQIDQNEFEEHVNNFLRLLDSKQLKADTSCQKAKNKIQQLCGNKIDIKLVKETESDAIKEHYQHVEDTIEELILTTNTIKDKSTLDKHIEKLEKLKEASSFNQATMKILQIESKAAEGAVKKIRVAYKKAQEKRTDMEVSIYRTETNELKKLKKVLKDAIEKSRRHHHEVKDNLGLNRGMEEPVKEEFEKRERSQGFVSQDSMAYNLPIPHRSPSTQSISSPEWKEFEERNRNQGFVSQDSMAYNLPIPHRSPSTRSISSPEWKELGERERSQGFASQGFMAYNLPTPDRNPGTRRNGSSKWKGIPINMLNTLWNCEKDLGPLQNIYSPSGSAIPHKVLFKTPFTYDGTTPPKPFSHFMDIWYENYVRMPCSKFNEYPSHDKDGEQVVRRKWDLIREVLHGDIQDPKELEEKILQYNRWYFVKWDFSVLRKFFVEECEDEERNRFFNTTLKKMVSLALDLPLLCTKAIPLLKAGKNQSITLSQQQIACLLANAFFCTFPLQNSKARQSEFRTYPSINFNSLFMGQRTKVKFEKLRCIINYFTRVCTQMPTGTVTFTRQSVEPPDWEDDPTYLTALHVSSKGTIEDGGNGLLQVDFANKFLGGGVLSDRCTQDEIRFLICPEMIVSRLFTEVLGDHECLIIKGCERFNDYDGCAEAFVWTANVEDKTPRDNWGRIQREVVAIDPLQVHDYGQQFEARQVYRELTKAYSGFKALGDGRTTPLPAVCTGNWGCGAFGGDKHLKALIQMMAAAKAERDVCYFTFDDERLCNEMYTFHQYITVTNTRCIGDLVKLVEQYRSNKVVKANGRPKMTLFEYILRVLDGTLEETTDEDSKEDLEFCSIYGDLVKLVEQYRSKKVVKANGRPKMALFKYILRVLDGTLEETTDEDSKEEIYI